MIKCCGYYRLSKEEKIQEESNSIQAQREIVTSFISQNSNFKLVKEYVDDGYSGSNFNRPGFAAMLVEIVNKNIDCIVVKDLSRFGREYIETGRYLQELFPKLGVRFISVGDNYDSNCVEFMEETLLVPILNLLNDAYCRDISMKVRMEQKVRRDAGDFIGAFPVFGYKKYKNSTHKLCVDLESAKWVQAVFFMRITGFSPEHIAKLLDACNIPSPLAYKKLCNSNFYTSFAEKEKRTWSPMAVRRILKNEIYKGILQQGKERKVSYKLAKRVTLPREEWSSVERKDLIIIPPWFFNRVTAYASIRMRTPENSLRASAWAGICKNKLSMKLILAIVTGFGFISGEENQTLFLFHLLVKSIDVGKDGSLWVVTTMGKKTGNKNMLPSMPEFR